MLAKKLIFMMALMGSFSTFGKVGTETGGGGDGSEMRVHEIRVDLLNWINKGGARDLVLPKEITKSDYEKKMKEILKAKAVVIGFTSSSVIVNDIPKTCRSFIAEASNRPSILCNLKRFNDLNEDEQYRLIHHEFAGLVNIENNEEAASDYYISSQITDYLVPIKVKKLAVKTSKKQLISEDCKADMREIVKDIKRMEEFLAEKKVTGMDYDFLVDKSESSARITALTCQGIKLIELQKSLKVKLRLLSEEKAEMIGQQVYQEAMAYYRSLLNK